jgi:nitrogen fixation/metabolism regulation signal transduction histidine kinase
VINYTPFWLVFGWLLLFCILALFELVRYVEKTNRDLSNFLLAIQQNDFSNTYPENRTEHHDLYRVFNIITQEFLKIRTEKESNYHFLKTVVEHSGVPLLAVDAHLNVTLVNDATKELLGIPHLTRLASIRRINEELYQALLTLRSDEKVLLKVQLGEELVHLSVLAKSVILSSESHKVLALHNINSELDQNEIESWQRLIRVLTHEIKNSVIPISTLSEVINQMVTSPEGSDLPLTDLDDEDEEDLRSGLRTIEKRSKGLVRFVTSYGDLAKVPRPQIEPSDIREMILQIADLEQREAEKYGITIRTQLPMGSYQYPIDQQMIMPSPDGFKTSSMSPSSCSFMASMAFLTKFISTCSIICWSIGYW